ncbi:common central domain of tyrosinase [Ancylostoma caninum]|uniref:Common central domain of tyrosinase n=1 Tax=Ancylostoma caninum TaxID=29170 RepID=A0A368GCB1_ANCCA|nr:common central domain of tyrosinase [Ancylostoma caninum]
MSDAERLRFHGAMWKIKQSGEYDKITRVHSRFELSPGAHSGPAFLPWHREFIKRVEIALRQIDPTIGLPYWDSTLDQALPDPSMSVLWSDELMGRPDSDGQGSRYFRRRIGARGQLMTRSEIEKVVTAPDISLLLSFTAPQRVGDMGVIPTATHDPIFFLHHSMMDLIWEEWRRARQSRTEREMAYPQNDEACSSAAHFANTTMTPFWPMVNLDGLSNKYTGLYEILWIYGDSRGG